MFLKAFVVVLLSITLARAGTCTPNVTELDHAYRSMYNLDFSSAKQQLVGWETDHPADPLGPVSEAASDLLSELYRLGSLRFELLLDDHQYKNRKRLSPDPNTKRLFDSNIDHALSLAKDELNHDAHSADAMFGKALALGLKADYAALIEKRDALALRYLKKGRRWSQKAIAADPTCYDAYLVLGFENYIVGSQPMVARALLRLGGANADKAKGIQELRLTAEKGRLLQPFAKLLLAVAALRDHDITQARALLQSLRNEFPRNPLYAEELTNLNSQPS